MKYTVETEINLPVDRVAGLFSNTANLEKWQPGFQSLGHISGTPGQPGAKSKLVVQMGRRRIEMIETVTVNNLPDEFIGTYEAKGVFNIVHNYFLPLPGNKTKFLSEVEFRFSGLMKVIGLLAPDMFRKQSCSILHAFKVFAEKEGPEPA